MSEKADIAALATLAVVVVTVVLAGGSTLVVRTRSTAFCEGWCARGGEVARSEKDECFCANSTDTPRGAP